MVLRYLRPFPLFKQKNHGQNRVSWIFCCCQTPPPKKKNPSKQSTFRRPLPDHGSPVLDCQNHCIPNWVVLLDPTFAGFRNLRFYLFFASTKNLENPWEFFSSNQKKTPGNFLVGGISGKIRRTVLCAMFFCEGCDCCILSAGIKFANLAVFLNAEFGCVLFDKLQRFHVREFKSSNFNIKLVVSTQLKNMLVQLDHFPKQNSEFQQQETPSISGHGEFIVFKFPVWSEGIRLDS